MSPAKIPDTTIEALTRNFYKESIEYGFQYEDYLKFVNILLEYAIEFKNGNTELKKKVLIDNEMDSKNFALPIETNNLIIRKCELDVDRTIINDWSKDKYGRFFLLSMTSVKHFTVDQILKDESNILAVITDKDNLPIGLMAYLNYDNEYKKAELRKLIGVPKLRGKGLGKEATKYWIQYGFKELGLNKIYLNTVDTNIRNIKLNEELGFKVEGILRNEVLIDGAYHDVLRMGLCRN